MEKYKILSATTRNFDHLWLKPLFKDVGGGRFEKIRYLLILWESRGVNNGKESYLTTYQGGGYEKIHNTVRQHSKI